MTVLDVMTRVAHISTITRDYEAAHAEEDRLLRDVLAAIAAGACDDPKTCAEAALASLKLKFPRHCA